MEIGLQYNLSKLLIRGLKMKSNIVRLFFCLICFSFIAFSTSVNSADVAAGKSKAMLCAACHGANGISSSEDIPNLAGQKAGYIAKAIRDFKSGVRKNGMMASVVPMIAEDDIDNIAAYFASLK